jgi:hypothetical protein
MLHRRVEIEKLHYRKKSTFFQNLASHKANLKLSPTYLYLDIVQEGDDY